MIRLIYISTARRVIAAAELDQILRLSRFNNGASDITGLLIASERRFLQALEGPADAVCRTFERIKGDARHFAVVELSKEVITERAFGGWSMAVQHSSPADCGGGLSQAVLDRLATIADPRVRGYFEGFAQRQAAA